MRKCRYFQKSSHRFHFSPPGIHNKLQLNALIQTIHTVVQFLRHIFDTQVPGGDSRGRLPRKPEI